MSIAIKIENLSKQYRLGLVSTKTLSHDLNRWWQTSILRREDPYLKIGQENRLSSRSSQITNHKSQITNQQSPEYVWALKDINLEVEQGEVLGIIGKNGAGKSTLLKILSKVTAPTTGIIKARGRIASLLEVGTGFHQEMTGRENIYMNGAIMGMSKTEITRKLDEIVDFAGVERYIDTPVKRYSSGMTVRLGFAVAAHLEPEILVVDEVLAVGDAEFQKKAIGKMQDISQGEGRTILFVSHNMSAVVSLCTSCVLLKNGQIEKSGLVPIIVDHYLSIDNSGNKYEAKKTNKEIYIKDAGIFFTSQRIIFIEVRIESSMDLKCSVDFRFKTKNGSPVGFGSQGTFNDSDLVNICAGSYRFKFQISVENWALGKYFVSLDLTLPDTKYLERLEDVLMFELFRNSNTDRRVLDLNWNYGAYQITVKRC